MVQVIEISNRVHQTCLNQLIDQLVSQSFDIHGLTRGKMTNTVFPLRRANQAAGTTGHRFTFYPLNCRATFRTCFGHLKFRQFALTPLMNGPRNFRYHIPCPAHHDPITGTNILAANFIFIMQCGVGYRHTANKNRFQTRNRCQCPGTAYLDIDIQ